MEGIGEVHHLEQESYQQLPVNMLQKQAPPPDHTEHKSPNHKTF
jgi:hypothetical protein